MALCCTGRAMRALTVTHNRPRCRQRAMERVSHWRRDRCPSVVCLCVIRPISSLFNLIFFSTCAVRICRFYLFYTFFFFYIHKSPYWLYFPRTTKTFDLTFPHARACVMRPERCSWAVAEGFDALCRGRSPRSLHRACCCGRKTMRAIPRRWWPSKETTIGCLSGEWNFHLLHKKFGFGPRPILSDSLLCGSRTEFTGKAHRIMYGYYAKFPFWTADDKAFGCSDRCSSNFNSKMSSVIYFKSVRRTWNHLFLVFLPQSMSVN